LWQVFVGAWILLGFVLFEELGCLELLVFIANLKVHIVYILKDVETKFRKRQEDL
jgi:hypothetical protein